MLVLPGIIVPGITAAFVDQVLIQRMDGWLGPLLIGLGVTFVLNAVLRFLQGRALLRIELRLALEQSARFTWHVLRLPMAFFNQRFLGDLVNRVDANDRVALLLARDVGNAATNCLTAAFLGAVMFAYDWVLAAIVLGSAALNIVILRLLNRPLSDVALRLQIEQGRLFSTSVVGLQSMETLKSTGGENEFFSKWAGYHARTINSEQQLAIYQQTIDLLPTILLSLTSAAVLGIGALHVIDDDLSIGALVAFQSLLINFSLQVQQVVAAAGKVRQAGADLARLDDVLHHEHDWLSSTPANAPAVEHVAGHLSMREVSFGYSPLDPPVIEGLFARCRPRSLGGAGGCIGQRQIHRRQADHRPVRAARRGHRYRRPPIACLGAGAAVPPRRLGRSGHPPLQGHPPGQYHAVGRHRGSCPPRRRDRRCGFDAVRPEHARQSQGRDRGGRAQPERRRAAASSRSRGRWSASPPSWCWTRRPPPSTPRASTRS